MSFLKVSLLLLWFNWFPQAVAAQRIEVVQSTGSPAGWLLPTGTEIQRIWVRGADVHITVQADQAWQLEYSVDLVRWACIYTNPGPIPGFPLQLFHGKDPGAAGMRRGFYRLVLVGPAPVRPETSSPL